jgi:hypothetical protein
LRIDAATAGAFARGSAQTLAKELKYEILEKILDGKFSDTTPCYLDFAFLDYPFLYSSYEG